VHVQKILGHAAHKTHDAKLMLDFLHLLLQGVISASTSLRSAANWSQVFERAFYDTFPPHTASEGLRPEKFL
jgi:hypothetical protein